MNMLLGAVLGFMLIFSILTIIFSIILITAKDSNDHFYKLQQSSYLKKYQIIKEMFLKMKKMKKN